MCLINNTIELLKYFDLSQNKFAERIGVSPQTINNIIKKGNKPSGKVIQGIAKEFPKINLRWLLLDEGEMLGKHYDNTVEETQPEYGNSDKDLRQALEDCRKDKERAWAEVEWLRGQIDEIKKKDVG